MSRSAAIYTFPDGEVFYGLHCNTVGRLCPLFFRTKEERDEYWRGYTRRPLSLTQQDYEPCGCAGEVVTTGPEYNEPYVLKMQGTGCREHGKYFGPYTDELPEEDYWTGWGR